MLERQGRHLRPNFFYSESMKQGYGIFNSPGFAGQPVVQTRKTEEKHGENCSKIVSSSRCDLLPSGSAAGCNCGRWSRMLQKDCASCHNLTGPAPQTLQALWDRKGPDLFYAGNKYRQEWLVAWLQKPRRDTTGREFMATTSSPARKATRSMQRHLATMSRFPRRCGGSGRRIDEAEAA